LIARSSLVRSCASFGLSIAVALAVALSPSSALAQAAPAANPATEKPAGGPAVAKLHLTAADKAAKAKDWKTALAEYDAATAASPSAPAAEGAASARYELRQTGEAYDAYEQLLKTYGTALGARKAAAEARLKELAASTGVLSLRVNEAGAAVMLDGAPLGTTPVAAVIRVGTGSHKIGVVKDGFAPVEKSAEVLANAKAIVEVNLVRESKLGHVVIKESAGAPVRVVLDGVDVGAAPFETDVEPGPHEIMLRSATMASAPQKIEVTRGKAAEVVLTATAATAHLEVVTSDRQGIVFLDGKPVAEGAFAADVSVGPHVIAVTREGFERFQKTLTLADKQTAVETVTLRRPQEAAAGGAIEHERAFDGVYGGFGVAPLFEPGGNGNDVESRCDGLGAASCAQSSPVGVGLSGWVGYAWHPVGLEVFLAGMYDQSSPSATFDGVPREGQNPLSASLARVEQFTFIRFGGMAALRARVSFQSSRVRGSLAAGFGVSVKNMLFERKAETADGLKNTYVDKSGHTYVSPALSIDGSVALRLTPSVAIALGALAWIETAGDDVRAAGSKNEYIGGNGVAAPIPTPAYRMAQGTQFFLGPYLGMQFGP
jgi:hypothetical protein